MQILFALTHQDRGQLATRTPKEAGTDGRQLYARANCLSRMMVERLGDRLCALR